MKIDYGQYCQVFDETTNDLTSRSVGAIALRPKNNRGSYYFMNLSTGRRIHANQWTELPITKEVINRVEELADPDGIEDMINGEPLFEWEPGRTILHENEQELVNDDEHETELTNVRKSTRDRKPPDSYIPSFEGKKYGAQMFMIPLQVRFAQYTVEEDCENNFEQMSFNRGQKLFGERAIAAMVKEYKQMDDMKVLGGVCPDTLTREQKHKALRAVNLIKQKRNKKIKGRMCANGAPHRKFVPREEAHSKTLSQEALVASLMIDSHEDRAVGVFDIPGAYLQTNMPDDKFALLKLEEQFVDIMCSINPEYEQYVRMENGKKTLYLRILKAIYGMIESALLWYELYVSVLSDMGFELNPYDICVANKIINGSQCTIAWYVDDNKVSHKQQSVVDDVIAKIEERFPGLTVSRGDEHTFLGMKIRYLRDKRRGVAINMREYLLEAIEQFGEDVSTVVSSPGANWLFLTSDARKLTGDKKDTFVSLVAKLLWIIQRGRPDC